MTKKEKCTCLIELDKLRMLHEEGKVAQMAVFASFVQDGQPMLETFSHKPDSDFLIQAIYQILEDHFEEEEQEPGRPEND